MRKKIIFVALIVLTFIFVRPKSVSAECYYSDDTTSGYANCVANIYGGKNFGCPKNNPPYYACCNNLADVCPARPANDTAPTVNQPIACNDVTNPEFNSDRPYPKSATCLTQASNYASFCGTDLTLKETITETYPGSGDCKTQGSEVVCNYNVKVPAHAITINLGNATLPFMGNTEDVLNSQNSQDTLNDPADKMNNYVSWYLNGVANKAEYGNSQNTNSNYVNYSGPIQKLLPESILDYQRIKSIEAAQGITEDTSGCVKKNVQACTQIACAANGTSYCCDSQLSCNTLQGNAQKTNHNQIVACAGSNIGLIGDITGWGKFVATNCYDGNGSPVTLDAGRVFRLVQQNGSDGWSGQLSWYRELVNLVSAPVTKLFQSLASTLPQPIENIIDTSLSNYYFWNKKIPPLPWGNDPSGKPFTETTFRKAYSEWQGKTCLIVPGINWMVCFDNILVPNKYSTLWSYIPLSSTEDLTGTVSISKTSPDTSSTNGVTVKNISFSNQNPSKLYFSHMEETDQLGSVLQDTYVPQGGDKVGNPTNIASGVSCNNVEVRTNKGDSLLADQISGDLAYTASFSCTFDATTSTENSGSCYANCLKTGITASECRYECANNPNSFLSQNSCVSANQPCGDGKTCCGGLFCNNEGEHSYCRASYQSCSKDIYIKLSTDTKMPLVENIWSRLVAGPMSVFKKIFPKTAVEGSVGQIMDIAGSTNITYSGTNVTQSTAELKLPHLGSISEYFLNGIQTALRPKGYGNSIEFAPNVASSSASTKINCDQTISEIAVNGLDKAGGEKVATEWYENNVGKNYFLECNNDVIKRAQAAGVDPVFALAIWIHESDASNYKAVSPVEDFGIHNRNSAPTNNFSVQLNAFLNLPNYYYSVCGTKDMNTFISMFWLGHCVPVDQTEANKVSGYINELKFIYSVIAPTLTLPNYPN